MKNHLNLKSRILAMFLVITLAVAQIMPVFAFSAETDPTIVVSEAIGAPGGTASVTVDLKNNPGIVSMTLSMSYNDEILTLTEVNDAGILGANAHKPEYVDPYTLAWVNDTATTNFTANGTIVTFVFTVAETAEKGTIVPIEIAYDYDNYDIYDKDGTQVRFEIDNGSVTVGEPGPNALSDFTYTTSGTELTITGYNGTANDVIIGSTYTIGDTEYTVVEIATEAFIGQETITSVVIPETVTTIGEAAFYDCLALTDVTVLSREAAIGEVAFGYYYASRKEYVVEGFTINGYTGSTAEAYAAADDEITFVALAEGCAHTGGEATCKDKAVCTACGASYGTVNAENHAGGTEIRDAVTASCNTPGYTGDTYCLGCNTKILDGKPVDATGNHVDADNKWESNETQHFHTCACGTKFDYTNHTGGEATCKDKAVCTACGTSYGTVNAENHAGDTEVRDALEPKCNLEGYTGDTYCKDCDAKIQSGEAIAKIPHNVDEWTVIKAATAEETGEKTGKCTACSEDITVITSKLVNNISPDKVEGDTKAELEAVGESNISEDVHFIANEVLDTLTKNELNEIQKVINNAADSIENEVKGKAVAAVFDLMLILRETSAGGDVIAERELELEGKVKVTLPLAKELLEEYTDLTLLHIKDDGSVEIIPFTLKNGKATFEASGFSYYTFVGTEKIDKIDSPKTGDDSNLLLWIALLFVSGSCLVVCTVGKKRAKHSK